MLNTKEVQKVQKTLKDGADRLPFVFEALADSTRLRIFRLLLKNKDLCVTDLANILKISVPGVSYQLKLMEMAGLIEKERMGQMICYTLKKNDPIVRRLTKVVEDNS